MDITRSIPRSILRQLQQTRIASTGHVVRNSTTTTHPLLSSVRLNTTTTLRRSLYTSTTSSASGSSSKSQQAVLKYIQQQRQQFMRSFRRYNSSSTTTTPVKDADLSLSQRLKKLSREYGWSAVGIYFALSALDFPFCFLAVRFIGADKIGHWEHVVLSYIKGVLKYPLPQSAQDQIDGASDQVKQAVGVGVDGVPLSEGGRRILEEENETYGVEDHGYKEAEQANSGANASIWTQLALAYAIHKSFIFIRVPLTAAITPKVVKTLRSWGWNIGKKQPKAVIAGSAGKGTGVPSAPGTGVKTGK